LDNNLILDHENAERILNEGWKLFQQKGYRGVTIDELCLRCGLSKPTLYYYFQDKENLFVQVLKYKLHGFHSVIEQPGTLSERLQRVAVSILESFQSEYSTLLRDRQHLRQPENLLGIRDAFRSEMFGPLTDLMLLGIQQGELEQEDPDLLTLVYLGIINNFIGKQAEMKIDNAALAEKLTTYFLKGVKKQ
jgi:TetR/AcrR family transcriptional repressor of mexJK operon